MNTVTGLTDTLVKPIALLKVQILTFGAITGLTLLTFGHAEAQLPLKCVLLGAGILAFFLSGGFYCFCVIKGYAGNSYEKAVAEQGVKIVATHDGQVDLKPIRKRAASRGKGVGKDVLQAIS